MSHLVKLNPNKKKRNLLFVIYEYIERVADILKKILTSDIMQEVMQVFSHLTGSLGQ